MTSTDAQEALDEAMFALSARLKLSGFLDDGANHAAYERVVAVWTNRLTPPTPAAEEREAVALAMLNGKRVREGWPVTAAIPEGFVDGDEWRLEARDALSALAPIRAAEILAAEANERARIVAWLRAQAVKKAAARDHATDPDVRDHCDSSYLTYATSADAIEIGAGK